MTEVNGETVLTQLNYTVNPRLAVGAYGMSENDSEQLSSGLYVNYLVMRRNTEDSQANAYVAAGAGPSWSKDANGKRGAAEASGWVAAEADWETRRVSVSGMVKASIVDGRVEPGWRLRMGAVPYVAETGKLHTWAILQVGRSAERGARTEITPLIRVFKGSVLAEAGVSLTGRGFGTLWFYF